MTAAPRNLRTRVDQAKYRLLSIREIPAWMRDNDYVRASYRPHLPSFRECFHTAFFTLNNDTINVWSHCIGFFAFTALAILILGPVTSVARHVPRVAAACRTLLPTSPHLAHLSATLRNLGLPNACLAGHPSLEAAVSAVLADHRLGMLPLLVAAVLCMLASTAYHAFWVYSPKALSVLGKLDFLGISILCCGHGVSGIFYLFYCAPPVAHRYYNAVIFAEVLTIAAIFIPGFSTPRARPIRALVFCALGSSVFVPLFHAGALHQWRSYEFEVAFASALGALMVYAAGAVIYVSRFPECCRVGMHDRFFASHQIMHIAVICGVALHLRGCYTLMTYRLEHGCATSPLVAA